MAVVTREKKAPEAEVIDPFEKGLDAGVETQLDAEADAWAAPPPPPKGLYKVKLFVPAKGFKKQPLDGGGCFYMADIEARIVGGPCDDTPLFANVKTYVARGKKLSTMAGLLVKGGQKIPAAATDLMILQQFTKWIKSEPIMFVSVDWNAWNADTQQNVFTSMDDFPDLEGGEGKNHIVEVRQKNGAIVEVTGKAKIKKWLTKEEAQELGYSDGKKAGKAGEGKKAAPVVAAAAAAAADEDEDDEEEEVKPVKKKAAVEEEPKKKKKTPPPPPPPADDDEDDEDEDMLADDDDEDDD